MDKNENSFFWPSYVDIMTNLFIIMLVLFILSFTRFKINEAKLERFKKKYEEIVSVYKAVENIDPQYFEYDSRYLKHIFKIKVNYPVGVFDINQITDQSQLDLILKAGKEIQSTINKLIRNDSITVPIKYLVVVEGQASADGYYADDYKNNDVLSYQRALKLNEFWKSNGLNFSKMSRCELVVSGSGEQGFPRDSTDEKTNQRFLIHIVPVVGNIKLDNWEE